MSKEVKRVKRKINFVKLLLFLLILLCIVFCLPKMFSSKTKISIIKSYNMYIASANLEVDTYEKKEDKFVKSGNLVRGTKISTNNKKIEDKYVRIKYDDKELFVLSENLVNDKNKTVLEKEIYIRTPSTVVDKDNKPVTLVKKGEKVEVLSYDKINDKGEVNKYKIKYNDKEGFIYGKYTVFDSESALKNYNQEMVDNVYSKMKNLYNGGEASKLDFYPYEKGNFEKNVMPEAVYSLYLNCGTNVINNIDSYIEFAKDTKINTFVVDIKDNQTPAYPSKVMENLSKSNYDHAINSFEAYKNAITKIKDAGFYVVGRITTFKDSYYVQDHPEDSIKAISTSTPYYHTGAYWPSPYDRDVWYFNVELAKEAVKEFGFNEINFDYVRFPDRMQKVESLVDMNNEFNEDKIEAIWQFVVYATDTLHELETYVSIDVFGESANGNYTTAYGQYWPSISNVADVISGMPYPDHFAAGNYGIDKPWNNPYLIMNKWGEDVYKRQSEATSPAKVRTWVQAYDVLKYVDANGISYNAQEVEKEIRGLYDAKLMDGYVTWLSNSSLEKYKAQKNAFKIDYYKEYNQ